MTKLFQAVVNAGVRPDFDNDNLMDCDEGMVWECPVDKAPDPLALLTAANLLLGSICRGVEVLPDHDAILAGPEGALVRIFLTEEYSD